MNIIDALLGEHAMLYTLFEFIEDRAAAGDDVDTLANLLETALLAHASVEDNILFPALEEHLGPHGPLAVMRADHHDLEVGATRVRTAAHLEGLMEAAREHFAKEEQVLFPAARQVFGADQLADLGRRWATDRGVAV